MSIEIRFRDATIADLPAIVALLADDAFGVTREVIDDPVDPAYADAFAAIEPNTSQSLLTQAIDRAVIGCLRLSFVPSYSRLVRKIETHDRLIKSPTSRPRRDSRGLRRSR